MLQDLESILSTIWNENTKKVVEESIRAYNVGAYRAAILTLWVAVILDIKEKIKYLAESGDINAQETDNEFVTAIHKLRENDPRSMQNYENQALQFCLKYNLIASGESDRINGLKTERDKCAHPSFTNNEQLFEPPAELYRFYLVEMVKNMFSRQPFDIKRISQNLEDDIKKASWPEESPNLYEYVKERYFKYLGIHDKETLIRMLIRNSLGETINDSTTKFLNNNDEIQKRSREIVCLFLKNDQESTLNTFRHYLSHEDEMDELSDQRLLQIVGLYGSQKCFWIVISSKTIMPKLKSLIKSDNIDLLIKSHFFLYGDFANNEIKNLTITAIYDCINNNLLTNNQLEGLICSTKDPSLFIPSLLNGIKCAMNFRSSSFFFKQLIECAYALTFEDVFTLESDILHDQCNGGFHQVLDNDELPNFLLGIAHSNLYSNQRTSYKVQQWLDIFNAIIDEEFNISLNRLQAEESVEISEDNSFILEKLKSYRHEIQNDFLV